MAYRNALESDFTIYKDQKDDSFRRSDLIAIDSGRLVLRVLKAGNITVRQIVCPLSFWERHAELISTSGAEVLIASEKMTQKITGFRIHQGVMALAKRPLDHSIEDLGPAIVVLNGVNNAENVGAIVRNALAFGSTSLIVDGRSCSPLVRRAIRVSMGSIFKCRIHHTENLPMVLQELRSQSYQIIASEMGPTSIPISQVEFDTKFAVVIGCEGDGISPEISQLADQSAFIEMAEGIDSLNAAVASGIVLHQASLAR